jgi:hypothetical protein
MKRLSLILLLLIFSFEAQAKITYNKKLFHDAHIITVRGFLYEVMESQESSIKKQIASKIARTIVWLDKIHKSKKIYEITKIKTKDANLVNASIKYIVNVSSGDIGANPIQIEEMLTRWYILGENLIAEYKNKHGKISWKLEIREPKKPKTSPKKEKKK